MGRLLRITLTIEEDQVALFVAKAALGEIFI